MQKTQKSGFGIVGIIIVIAAVVVLGGGFIYWRELQRLKNFTASPPASQTQNQQVQQPNTPVPPAGIDTSNWKTYRNEKYGITFRYPNEWLIKEDIPQGFSVNLDAHAVELYQNNTIKEPEIDITISCLLPWSGLDEARVASENYTKVDTYPSFIQRVGFEVFSGALIKEFDLGIRKLFVFRQGCYECYEGDERKGTDGFSAIICVSGKNRNNNVSDRCLRLKTRRYEINTADFRKLQDIFLNDLIPSLHLESNFDNVSRCVGHGETKG